MKPIQIFIFFCFLICLFSSSTSAIEKTKKTQILSTGSDLVESVLAYSQAMGKYRTSYTYNEDGEFLTSLSEMEMAGSWMTTSRDTYSHEGNTSICITENFDGEWVKSNRSTDVKDENGNLILSTQQKWNGTEWTDFSRRTMTWNDDGNVLMNMSERWQGNAWVGSMRFTFEYNAEGDRSGYLFERWNGLEWENVEKITNTYDGQEQLILVERWDGSEWIKSQLETLVTDENDNWLEYLYQVWEDGQWVNESIEYYTYDQNGYMVEYIYKEWQYGSWQDSFKEVYNNDEEGKMLTYEFFAWQNEQWETMDNYLYFQDTREREFIFMGYKLEVTYVGASPVTENSKQEAVYLDCYPNPTSNSTTIEYNINKVGKVSIDLINSAGQVEKSIISNQKTLIGKNYLDLRTDDLSPGVYYLTIQIGNHKSLRKLIVIR
jgi:hypothetical protein